jgi:hypothetical protein
MITDTRPPEAAPPPSVDQRRLEGELVERQRLVEERLRILERAAPPREEPADAGEGPLAGYSDKNFFFRDHSSNFVFVPKGRINVDYYHFLNRGTLPTGAVANGATDTRPRDTVFIRRARVGFAGTLAKVIDYRFEADFVSPPAAGQYGTVTDASLVYNSNPYLQIEVGQFYTPFTLENPTSENYTDFMEKAAPVRLVVPGSREIGGMLLGQAPQRVARYWVGLFNGDGANIKNLDHRAAVIGRAVVSPLALLPGHDKWLEDVWVGGSFWTQRSTNLGGAAPPSTGGATQGDLSSFTTQSGWTVFNSNYSNGKDAAGNGIRSHLGPSGNTTKYAFELNVPIFYRVGLRAEYMVQAVDVREYNDVGAAGVVTRTPGQTATIKGTGGYGEVYVWLGHDVNVDRPGLYQPPHWRGYEEPPSPSWAVMLAAKYEHVALRLDGLAGTVNPTGTAVPNPAAGRYALDVYELGANFWYTRHVRFSVNYLLNYLGAGDGSGATNLTKNLFYRKAKHELLLRWAVSL